MNEHFNYKSFFELAQHNINLIILMNNFQTEISLI
jgi:hypothetical protein